ncbi:unnamed protein product [Adineta steineri]|uniref:Uncharacterized protein n=1 Tax=Adineta steineri TaxID=433720 RepID=A0A813NCD7_9BILA|nr:unnamed protein product [Adineta steineri]
MRPPMVGMPAPRFVHSCTIRNNSNGNIKVQILYRGPAPEGQGFQQEASTVDIPVGGYIRAKERSTNHGSYQTRKEIAAIKVLRANGQKQKIVAPFEGVNGVELNWIFIVDNYKIQSVNPHPTTNIF